MLGVWRCLLGHLVGSFWNRVSPGCWTAHSLAGCNCQEPRSQVSGYRLRGPLSFAEVQLCPDLSGMGCGRHEQVTCSDVWLLLMSKILWLANARRLSSSRKKL